MKKIISIPLLLALFFLLAVPVFADDETEMTGGFVPIGIGASTDSSSSGDQDNPDQKENDTEASENADETQPAGQDNDNNELEITDESLSGSNPDPSGGTDSGKDPDSGESTGDLPFVDVPDGVYFTDSVKWACENRITTGVDETHFDPEGTCTRAQIVTLLWRMAGKPAVPDGNPFLDVRQGSWYCDAVLWAVEKGITKGISEDRFAPDDQVTRAQIVTFLYRDAGEPESSEAHAFTDVEENSFYEKAVSWAVKNGITKGLTDTSFGPDELCTRAQAMTFLYRASKMNLIPDPVNADLQEADTQAGNSTITDSGKSPDFINSEYSPYLAAGVLMLFGVGAMVKFL